VKGYDESSYIITTMIEHGLPENATNETSSQIMKPITLMQGLP